MECSKLSSKREVYSNTILTQETRNISNNNLTLHINQLEKEEQNNPKVNKRIEIIKIRSEINEKEMKETIAKINKISEINEKEMKETIAKINKKLVI